MPKTKLGKWSCLLVVVMLILFVLSGVLSNTLYRSVEAGDSILSDIETRPALVISMLLGTISGIVSFVLGIRAVIVERERSILVYGVVLVGGLLVLILVGEIFGSH